MHQLGIAHRDVKPSNVFFSEDNILKVGNPLLPTSSFDEKSIQNVYKTTSIGTVSYLAPEVFNAVKDTKISTYDAIKSDCWAFGVFIYELLTYQLPFKFKSFDEFKQNLSSKDFKLPLLTVSAKISQQTSSMLKDIYRGLLNQDPKK